MIPSGQFARWSFERDRSVGLYKKTQRWESIEQDERQLYIDEAEHYLTLPQDEWPDDILERLNKTVDDHPL